MDNSIVNQSKLDKNKLDSTFDKINTIVGSYIIRDKIIQIDIIYDKITNKIKDTIDLRKKDLNTSATVLNSLSPLSTLDRGYSILQKNKKLVNSVDELDKRDLIEITLRDGKVDCIVEKIKFKEV